MTKRTLAHVEGTEVFCLFLFLLSASQLHATIHVIDPWAFRTWATNLGGLYSNRLVALRFSTRF
jgi:hypothetical protein